MADTHVKENGVYAWMASVRASMDDDSSRKIFENQVQSHAFSFLDNYLEHILAGPKQVPIIELVKTPRRKRNVPRRTKAAAVAAGAAEGAAPFSLDDDDSTKDVIPVNSFHKALLQAKERSIQGALDLQKPTAESPLISYDSAESKHGPSKPTQLADIPEVIASIEPGPRIGAMPLHHDPRHTSSEAPLPASEHGIHLSVIAESNESPDRSHAISTVSSSQDELPQIVPQLCQQVQEHPATEGIITVQIDLNPQGNPSSGMPCSVPSPVDAHPCVPFGSPREVRFSEAPTSSHTEPLPLRIVDNPQKVCERNAFTAPLPPVPVSNPILPPQTFSVPLNDISPKTLPHKNNAAGFPTLPAPSPLRKSMRFTQDAPTNTVYPAVVPAPVPLGKRTSWLMKAREAKAMEGTSSLPGTSMGVASTKFTRAPTALKRKSGEMLGELSLGPDVDEDQRRSKVGKSEVVVGPPETGKAIQHDFLSVQGELVTVGLVPVNHLESHVMDVDKRITLNSGEDGFIDLFKRTVEGLGARAAKSASKSLGGAVVTALAEARAAAEARVAERNKVNIGSDSEALLDGGLPGEESIRTQALDNKTHVSPAVQADRTDRRLSLSDLASDTVQDNITELTKGGTQTNSGDESISATPPESPPSKGSAGFIKLTGPVFNKPPPPVFMPPTSKRPTFNNPSGPFTLPAGSLDIHARPTAPSNVFPPLVQGMSKAFVQPSQCDTFSNPIVDKLDGIPPRAAPVQDSLYNIHSQLRDPQPVPGAVVDDDDDSWPLEEKLAAAESGWRPFDFSNVDKEDTWSSLPTESQGPTRSLTTVICDETMPLSNDPDPEVDTKGKGVEPEQQDVEISDAECSNSDSSKPNDLTRAEATGLGSVGSEPVTRAASQASMASTISSQSQVGFFSQATRLVNNMLSGGKKAKPELKSLQLAAVAAKKQQEEADKKTQRLKDMEARRQVAIAKKAEEEMTRLMEEERRNREDFERRKREREENTDRRPLKPPISTKKADDDASKKRKVVPESEKKQESKKPPARDKKDLAPPTKLVVTPAMKPVASKSTKGTTTALVSSAVYNAAQNPPSTKSNAPEAKPFKVVSSLKGKAKSRSQEDDIPSTMVQSQMAARAKAQMQTAKVATPEIPSESIELPEINSEYSDSEDEDRVRTFDPPEWAQSPELHQALQMQSTVNPDDIFGEIRPLRMEEMFRTRQSRFRTRTSSANWSGTDRLTLEEIREYERRMGFQSARGS